ncbi:glycosyltransferase family 8 protein [Hymenobacter metallicola]|uniref:Glycosyltransferase family 8 protein n=1 Tax=Hymenobacter metallicola TaxID=2563114 RepID=A0A4Z0Q2A8_9BACT|nr:glycosyltransferase family 8 protein [Hymenobacter metallicola]TGE23231.1 glycosyltransferase family 8 protein [Hymenobacter metallicola]
MPTPSESIHVAIAFDENYLTPVYALLTSIFANNGQESVVIHAIATGLSQAERKELSHYVAGHHSSIHYYDIEDSFANDFVLPPNLWWTASIYYRVMFPALLPADVKRFIYLDTDIIVLGKLRSLYDIAMEGFPVAAVRDFVDARPELGIHKPGNYFNSGVLLIDRSEWLRLDITTSVIDFIRNNSEKLVYPDQDALNAVLVDNWLKLSTRFNTMFRDIPKHEPRKRLKYFLQDTVILHYTTQHKPWSMLGENRLRDLYFKYLDKVPKKYRRRYDNFSWNRHKIRKMLEIRLSELFIDYPALVTGWRRK